ncbi:MAG: tyrosine-protein phosphatase [Actinomycetota bacterium]|nr:tyrosine-protein phosphatase [Actinomycetota bacterium]
MQSRELSWEGCLNVRDLGGHPTENGHETRFGAVVRADSIRRLTDAGWEALAEHGVATIVDLRVESELAEDPPRELKIEVLHVSVVPELDSPHWDEIDAIGAAAEDHVSATRDVYLEFLDRFGENFGRAIAEVARAPDGAVVVHCAGGKDRTGLVVALLLRLVGVSLEDIAADYAASEANLHDELDQWIQSADDEVTRAKRRRIAATPAEAMTGVLEAIERRHGSVRGYLRRAGVSDDDLDRARARLVE